MREVYHAPASVEVLTSVGARVKDAQTSHADTIGEVEPDDFS